MRLINLALCAALLVPLGGYAQGIEGALYKEVAYVLRTHQSVALEDLDDCTRASGHLRGGTVFRGETSSLYAVTVDENSGKVTSDQATKVGEILACWGQTEHAVEGPGYPTEDTEVVYEFDLGGEEFFALGTSRLRTPGDFLESGMHLTGVDATVFKIVDGALATVLGTMSVNRLVNPASKEGYREGDMITLRFFTALNEPNYAALIAAMRRAGLLD